LHRHAYREFFGVLEGSYEFTLKRDGKLEMIAVGAGSSVLVPPEVPHTFKQCDRRARPAAVRARAGGARGVLRGVQRTGRTRG